MTSFLPLQFFVSVRLLRVQFSDQYKNVGITKVLYIFKIVSVLTFLKIVLLIVSINRKNFANLNSTFRLAKFLQLITKLKTLTNGIYISAYIPASTVIVALDSGFGGLEVAC